MSWRPSGEGVEVETTQSRYTASRLIVTAGAWASDLLATAGLQTPLRVLRKHLHWHRTADPRYRSTAGHDSFPVFFFEEPADCDGVVRFFYGFPQCDERGVKVAEHTGGSETPDPLTDPRDTEADDIARVSAFVGNRAQRGTGCQPVMIGVLRTCGHPFLLPSHPAHQNPRSHL